MANVILPWVYTSDRGLSYVTGVETEVAAQLDGAGPALKIGGRQATVADGFPPLPGSVKPRRAYLKNAAGKGRYITVMEPTAALASVGETLNIEDSDGASTAFTVRHILAERFGRSRV